MTFDDKLRDMTNDIGRGTQERDLSMWKAAHDASHFPAFGHVLSGCPYCDTLNGPLASDAMAERDEHGEVKGVLF